MSEEPYVRTVALNSPTIARWQDPEDPDLEVPDGCTGYVDAGLPFSDIQHDGTGCPIHERQGI